MTVHQLCPDQLISISGLDGAGKSTQIANLAGILQAEGVKPRVLWSRGGYTGGFSALKLLVRRARTGLIPPPGQSVERTAAMGRAWVRRLWLALALPDLIWLYGVRVRWWRWRGRAVICDRYLWDTLVDFRLSFPAEDVERWPLWRFLVRVCPEPDVDLLLVIPPDESLRRSRGKGDRFRESETLLRRRHDEYRLLQEAGRWSIVIDAARPEDQVWADIAACLTVAPDRDGPPVPGGEG